MAKKDEKTEEQKDKKTEQNNEVTEESSSASDEATMDKPEDVVEAADQLNGEEDNQVASESVNQSTVPEKPKKAKKVAAVEVDVKKLLEAGAHFGHQTQRWNPKMAEYIFTKKNNIHIIDLFKTVEKLKEALVYISEISANGGSVLYLGTKNQAKAIVKEEAERSASPYINEKWLGGMLTNFSTIASRIKYMKELEKQLEENQFVIKKEKLDAEEELKKIDANFGGIREMKKLPEAIFIIDSVKEKNAVKEAKILGIKVIAICDTNSNPEEVDFAIPANDDAIKAIKYITGLVSEAILTGKASLEK